MEVRICMQTSLQATVKVTVINGYKKYKLAGISTGPSNEAIDLNDRLFYNRSYFFTDDAKECLERLSSNQSDYSTVQSQYPGDISAGIAVLVPFLTEKTSILSAYDLKKIKSKDDSSALSNFKDIDLSVYLHLLILMTMFLACIGLTLFVTLYGEKIRRQVFFTPRPFHRVVRYWSEILINLNKRPPTTGSTQSTLEKCVLIIQQSSIHLKQLTFLFALLSFFVLAFFNGAYSTGRIIKDQRRIIKTYEELIEDHTALVFFYDQLRQMSPRFKNSEAVALRGRVWLKLTNQPGNRDKYVIKKFGRNIISQVKAIFASMEETHSVIIAASYSNLILSWLICGLSPENQLRTSLDFVDPSEIEILEGFSLNSNSALTHFMQTRFRRLIDSHVLLLLTYSGVSNAFELGWKLARTSTEHKFLHQKECLAGSSEEEDTASAKDMGTQYYVITFINCAVIYLLALAVLFIELTVSRSQNQGKFDGSATIENQRRRGPRQGPFRPIHYI